jgi:hypothetical protein
MFVTKQALPRRTFLRGMGVTLALPLMDAMVPALTALSQTAANPIRRLGCLYHANGTIEGDWIPKTVGANFELSPILRPLASVRDQLIVVTGLDHHEADTKGDGQADHPRATAVWLSGVHAWTRPAAEIKLGTTFDQIAAETLGKDAPLRSLELSLDGGEQSACDSDNCFYSNTVSWRNATTPLPMETHPRVVFERLFGEGGTPAQQRARLRKTSSILDSVTAEVSQLERRLGVGDRGKLDEYLGAVRDVEGRIQRVEKRASEDVSLASPTDIPEDFQERARLMIDLQVLAFQADVTRVFTFLLSRENSSRPFPEIGVPDHHHSISHHMDKPALMAKKAQIDTYLVTQFAYLLERLRATPDGDGTLLDHSVLLYGGGIANGNLHSHHNLPCLVAGGAGLGLKGGRHVQYPAETPMSNLFLTLLDKLGVPAPDRIGDSTGPVTL